MVASTSKAVPAMQDSHSAPASTSRAHTFDGLPPRLASSLYTEPDGRTKTAALNATSGRHGDGRMPSWHSPVPVVPERSVCHI